MQLAASPQPRSRLKGAVSWGAGILTLGLLLGVTTGVVWGLFRPAYALSIEDGKPVIDETASPANVEFVSFAWFAVLTGIIGVVLGLVAYLAHERRSGVGRLLFVVAVTLFASWSVYVLSSWSAGLVNDVVPAFYAGASSTTAGSVTGGSAIGHEFTEGQTFTVVPVLAPGVAWLVGPFAAAVTYWIGLVVALASTETRSDASSDPGPVHGRAATELDRDIVEH